MKFSIRQINNFYFSLFSFQRPVLQVISFTVSAEIAEMILIALPAAPPVGIRTVFVTKGMVKVKI